VVQRFARVEHRVVDAILAEEVAQARDVLGDERAKAYKENQRVLDEIRARLNGLNRETRDGLIGTEPVAGVL